MKNLYKSFSFGMIMFLAGMPVYLQANTTYDSHHSTPISTVSSRTAAPVNIRVKESGGNIVVTGALKRRHGQHLKIRGNVIVNIIGKNGKVIATVTKAVKSKLGNVKSNHYLKFSIVIPNTSLKKHTVQVVHKTT